MTQEKGMAEMMKKRYPFIDLIYGTHNLYKLPEYIYRALSQRQPVIEVMDIDGEVVEGMPIALRIGRTPVDAKEHPRRPVQIKRIVIE
jgi:hypothetical protein